MAFANIDVAALNQLRQKVLEEGMNWFLKNYNKYGDDDYPNEKKPSKYDHEWINTGLRKTWCKHCKAEGYYEMGNVKTQDGDFCNRYRYYHNFID